MHLPAVHGRVHITAPDQNARLHVGSSLPQTADQQVMRAKKPSVRHKNVQAPLRTALRPPNSAGANGAVSKVSAEKPF